MDMRGGMVGLVLEISQMLQEQIELTYVACESGLFYFLFFLS
jgi:hypothetical protein